MMAALLASPEQQFCDANGKPYAAGTITTYVVDTSTLKATWRDPNQLAFNSNPVVLDAAGRCVMYGDGDYRLVLRDAVGNLVWDQPASTIVSAAMEPVVSAPTLADASELLGVDAAIAAEAAARAAEDSAEINRRIAADLQEANWRTDADKVLQDQIDTINATIAALPPTGGPIHEYGAGISDSDGHKRVTFPIVFLGTPAVVAEVTYASYSNLSVAVVADTTGFDVWFAYELTSGITAAGPTNFYWIAVGQV